MKDKDEMQAQLDVLLNEDFSYDTRIEAYEYLSEDCDNFVDDMLSAFRGAGDGDTAKMLLEILSNYKGNKEIYLALVSWLYRGDDVALFASLLGRYGDEQGIDVLKGFLKEYEPNYHEYMEIRSAIEELGGYFEEDSTLDFSTDELYRHNKGLDTIDGEEEQGEQMMDDVTNPNHVDDAADDLYADEADVDESNADDSTDPDEI